MLLGKLEQSRSNETVGTDVSWVTTVPRAAWEIGKDQQSVSIFAGQSGPATYAEGNWADLMMSSADLLWAAKAAESRSINRGEAVDHQCG